MSSAGFGALSGFTSILIMSCIAYNRYKCVLHPFASLSLQYDKSRVANMLIASFSTSAVLSALPVAYNGYFAAGKCFKNKNSTYTWQKFICRLNKVRKDLFIRLRSHDFLSLDSKNTVFLY